MFDKSFPSPTTTHPNSPSEKSSYSLIDYELCKSKVKKRKQKSPNLSGGEIEIEEYVFFSNFK